MKKYYYLSFCVLCSFYLRAQQEIKMTEARFKTGDNKSYSQPGFNDSQWIKIKTSENWDQQGFQNYDGYAWYRFHVIIPSSLKNSSAWKDSLRINLAKIDDADEVYLNGKRIGKDGSFPDDPSGYISKWDEPRVYHLSTNDPVINWDAENIITIKVYDGGGLGGMF
ncbi:MAG: hypothetical protein JST10_14550, partial [Bacteroidetes bacterium]|nr:hypothetical protein [Bacteroidota bacterium]